MLGMYAYLSYPQNGSVMQITLEIYLFLRLNYLRLWR